jgi:hypothetical protein
MSDKKEMAIAYDKAVMICRVIKMKTDDEGAKIIQQIAEVSQEKIIAYIKELKGK